MKLRNRRKSWQISISGKEVMTIAEAEKENVPF